jgi:TRAP-type C4-dicarboxylate transport system permease small subunit
MQKCLLLLWRLEAVLAGALLVLMVLLIFLSGVARTLGHPMNWTGDMATAFFAWACFLCADIAWRRNALMSIELVTQRLPAAWRRVCSVLSYSIIVFFLIYGIGYGLWLSWISRTRSFQGISEISYSWVTMSMPIGCMLLLLTAFLRVRDEFATGRRSVHQIASNIS